MQNLELCKVCGGRCCKTLGCSFAPADFKDLSFDGLKGEIEKGFISIDWWDNNPFQDDRNIKRALFLRIRNVDSPIVDSSWGGVCSLLTENGCSIDYENRPTGGKLLEPKSGRKCIQHYSKQDCAKDWYKYNDILIQLEKHFKQISKTNNV